MKKLITLLVCLCLFSAVCACSSNEPTVVGSWDAAAPLFQTEEEIDEYILIFYDSMEAEEKHIKGSNTYKTHQFDYETDGSTLTIYAGAMQTTYTITFGENNGTDTMQLTAPDGTVYSYTLRTRSTPGIHT